MSPAQPVELSPNVVEIDNPKAAEGLRLERSMIEDVVAPQEVANYRELQSKKAFFDREAVFLRGCPNMYALAGGEDAQVTEDQIGIAQIPVAEEGNQSYSCLGGANMYMNASSRIKDAAWEFIKFMTAPEQQEFRAQEGSFLPALDALYDEPKILKQVPVVELAKDIIENNLRARPSSPDYPQVFQRMAVRFNDCLSGDLSPEETVATLQKDMKMLLA